jgi:hypothetical protein
MNAVVTPSVAPSSPNHHVSIRIIALASLIGTTVEWYD